jgi:hypothetical protein
MKKPLTNTVVNYRELRAQKARLGLTNEQIELAAKSGPNTVSAFLSGSESMQLRTIINLAAAIGLRVKVDFEPIPKTGAGEDQKFKLIA